MKLNLSKTKANRLLWILLCAFLVLPAPVIGLQYNMAQDNDLLIAHNSTWKYLDDGSNQKTAWRYNDFDDTEWKTGAAPLGYGGGDLPLATIIQYGSNAANKPITAYFRHEFTVDDASEIKQLSAALIRDDGAVVYLNGNEVYRTNMRTGPIAYNSVALEAVDTDRAANVFAIDPWLLESGSNVMTVEVHQNSASSSDLFFSLELRGESTPLPKDKGLYAEYYTNMGPSGNFAFDERKAAAVDPSIQFADLNPVLARMTGMEDTASVRWTGQIEAPATGEYKFYVIGDNGFRLWVDDMSSPLIDFWVDEWDKEQESRLITLEAGRKYDIKMEYFEHFGGANLFLKWSGPGIAKELVPASALSLPKDYMGPIGGKARAEGQVIDLKLSHELAALPQELNKHFLLHAEGRQIAIKALERNAADASIVHLVPEQEIIAGQSLKLQYDGSAGLQSIDGQAIGSFVYAIDNESMRIDYSPVAIAMSLYGSAKTSRSFAWYTSYNYPDDAPANAMDSVVEVVRATENFDSPNKLRFEGESRVLQNLKYTNFTTISFIGHKALVEGLTPGTPYKYRLGSDGYWSETGTFVTEADNESEFEFLYMTDSQGGNSGDYEVWANTLNQAVEHFPQSQFLVMTGDMVDGGALESQWLDYFGKPQQTLMHLPIMAAVGNHEGPYNDNYYYHFNYPNDQIDDPLPPGSVYSFDYGDAHFMILNTMDMGWDARQRESFMHQIEWLRREVAETDKKWKVVAFHKAIYSVGGHSKETEIYELRDMLYPVFDELGIDVVLQGHDHSYVRTHQMYGDKAVLDVKKDANGNPLNPKGTMYMINNAAGTKYYDIRNDIDDYYSAVKEQPKKPIFSGIRMTKDSFTVESYRAGEDQPFDEYTIVRDDSKPEAVQNASGGLDRSGHVTLAWSVAEDETSASDVRGFRIYETSDKLGRNWSLYVPAEEGKRHYSQMIESAQAGEAYEFVVRAVDERNNSDLTKVAVTGMDIASPYGPVVDDGYNLFYWKTVPGFDALSDYEFTLDGGSTWEPVTVNPLPIGDVAHAIGQIGVRVKADEGVGREAGLPLWNDKPFTVNSIHDVFAITGNVKRANGLSMDVNVVRRAPYEGSAYMVFQLMDGNIPVLINAVPIKGDKTVLSQHFEVEGSNYKVRAFVFDSFGMEGKAPLSLARSVELK
ncbi:PA14 domain-containing protein [Paenibacillus sp. PL2-23]|uniref:PA14 domain-containing protein n=1 Tax=Paenibacillus sp. PL2-23 TaxID=2100729 RepID=UPI0030FB16D0